VEAQPLASKADMVKTTRAHQIAPLFMPLPPAVDLRP
jgi:hypothetical protein